YDPKDFQDFVYQAHNEFVITYTGTISKDYPILPFLDALTKFQEKFPQRKIKLRFVGVIYEELKVELAKRNLDGQTEFTGYVSHKASIEYLGKSVALLLLGPLNKNLKEGGIPAKVFEYLASSRPIIYIGKADGFVADILDETSGGKTFSEDIDSILEHLEFLYIGFESKTESPTNNTAYTQYSRKELAKRFIQHIK
ncbi:MAG: glycosyltransferase, partial [Bacteroidia bacterium]|nr:glycosyltransferase [Bacteroidia bacterium]